MLTWGGKKWIAKFTKLSKKIVCAPRIDIPGEWDLGRMNTSDPKIWRCVDPKGDEVPPMDADT